jgi:peptide/nickel transport system substrate-binding protein
VKSATFLRYLGLIAIFAMLALLTVACGGDDDDDDDGAAPTDRPDATTDTSGTGGVLRIGMSAGNIPIPNTAPDQGFEGRRFVGFQIYDGLTLFNVEQGDTVPGPVPGLAESWTIADDQLTWTFNLRPGVTFHDGTPFDADAVVFNFDRITDDTFEFYDANMRAASISYSNNWASYRKVDDMTIEIVTKVPYSFLLDDLALVYFASPTAVETYGVEGYVQHATGTGPFVMTRYVDGEVMELEPFADYWGEKARLEKLILYPMPEPATRLAALQSGEIDWAEVPPPDSISQLESQGFQVLLKEYPHVITHQLNTYKAPFDNVLVRRAVNYAMDKEGTVALINGVGSPALQYMYEGHPYYDPDWEGYPYDPERAKELLAEAGYPDGFDMVLAYPTGGSGNMFPGPMVEKTQQDLAAIGIDAQLVPLEWNNVISGFRAGFANPDWQKYDALYFSTAPLTPVLTLGSYVTERIPPAGCCNTSGISIAEVDALFNQAKETFDKEEQDLLMRQATVEMMKQAPVLITVHDLNLRVLSPKVKGFVQPQSWFVNLKSVWVES